jgi:ribonucleoside-diphosphate reductase alpha chain
LERGKVLSEGSLYEALSNKRKKAQEEGKYPHWYTTGGYQMFEEKYKYQASGFREQAERIARTAAKHLKKKDLVDKFEKIFFDMLWEGNLSCSTPVLANTGTNRGMPVSCSGTYVKDSVAGFYTNRLENAVLTQEGFGTSAYLGDIRCRGSEISRGGKAAGILPVMDGLRHMSMDVSQGGVRRGAVASYVPIDHGDFWECVSELRNNTESLNIGWNISDSFISLVAEGYEDYSERFMETLDTKMVTGKGYYFFPDKVNRHNPPMYSDRGMEVKASNLCVAPETEILTDKGYFKIAELEGKEVNVWNGEVFSKTVVYKTNTNQELLEVVTTFENIIECTPYHKFFVKRDYHKPFEVVAAKDLVEGDKLLKTEWPIIEGIKELSKAYTNGFYTADGTLCNNKYKKIYLYGEKMTLKDKFEHEGTWIDSLYPQVRSVSSTVKGLEDKYFVPDNTYTIKSRLDWLAGFSDGDGTIARNGTNESLQMESIHLDFLKDVRKMLHTLGVESKLTFMFEEQMRMMPKNDGTGDSAEYLCKRSWRLLVSSSGLYKLSKLGFKTYRLEFKERLPQREAERFTKVKEVNWKGRISDTYCFTEPLKNAGVFNGILAGNCNEICLFSDEDHSFTCVLSALNLARYNIWKDTDAIFNATVFLDCIASEFIEKGKDIPYLENAIRFTEKGRALGLGVCGFHTYLMQEGIAFESFEAHMFNNRFFAELNKESKRASEWLAKELGEPEWCVGYGVRNTHRTALMPTKSTALIMGGVSEGINPDPAMVFTQASSAGEIDRVNPVFLSLMKELGQYTKSNIESITENRGSVQHFDWLSEEKKLIFKTAFEIDQEGILRMASQRGKQICQWQSLNLFFAAEEDEEYIAEIHQKAFLDEGIRGLYYVYSKAGITASKDECVACQ